MEKQIENYLITIEPDDYPDDPREWDNLSKMVCFHNRYKLGDEHNYDSDDYNGWDEMEEDIIKNENVAVILPLYLYDHSGITISTSPFSCPWDSGQVGFVFITKKDAKKEFGCKIITPKIKEKLLNIIKNEVETYDQYLRGDVYCYKIEKIIKDDCGCEYTETVDSCHGYYGEEYCLNEAESVVEYYLKEEKHENETV